VEIMLLQKLSLIRLQLPQLITVKALYPSNK
jgi:hypothetical protein